MTVIKAPLKTPEATRPASASRTRRSDSSSTIISPLERVLFLQRSIGNQAVQGLLTDSGVQRKLKIGRPSDVGELEIKSFSTPPEGGAIPRFTVGRQPETLHGVLRRKEEEPTRRQIARDDLLRRLAVWPNEALYKWSHLNSGEQMVVVLYMTGNYGHDFADQFLATARRRRRPEPVAHWTNILRETHEQLRQRGYRLVMTSMGIEHWVHPSGDTLHRILPTRRSRQPEEQSESAERRPPHEEPSPSGPGEESGNPARIDPSADPEAAYGPEVHSRDGAEIMGQTGRAVEHEDGTILLYPAGSRTPVTYRPQPGGYNAYEYYRPDGVKVENVIIWIDPGQVFRGAED